MIEELEDVLKNFDIDKGLYKVGKLELKINELSVDEFEQLQVKEAEMTDIDGTTMKASEALKIEHDFNEYVLTLAFGKKNYNLLKKSVTAGQYRTTVQEVFVFLAKFSGPEKARDFITILTEKKASAKKNTDITS